MGVKILTAAEMSEALDVAREVVSIVEQFQHGELSASALAALILRRPGATLTLAQALLSMQESSR